SILGFLLRLDSKRCWRYEQPRRTRRHDSRWLLLSVKSGERALCRRTRLDTLDITQDLHHLTDSLPISSAHLPCERSDLPGLQPHRESAVGGVRNCGGES